MNFNKDNNNLNLGIFDSKEDFVKHYIFKNNYNTIRYTKYIDCEKFVEEWKVFKYRFNSLQNGKILVSKL